MAAPDLNRIPPFYHGYVNRVQGDNVQEALRTSGNQLNEYLQKLSVDDWSFRYQPGKWSIKEMVQHLIDAERIFVYRALCFARGEKQPLPGFDENNYARASEADQRVPADLQFEVAHVREDALLFYRSLQEAQLQASGNANGKDVYVEGIGFIIAGHTLHHLEVLRSKYNRT